MTFKLSENIINLEREEKIMLNILKKKNNTKSNNFDIFEQIKLQKEKTAEEADELIKELLIETKKEAINHIQQVKSEYKLFSNKQKEENKWYKNIDYYMFYKLTTNYGCAHEELTFQLVNATECLLKSKGELPNFDSLFINKEKSWENWISFFETLYNVRKESSDDIYANNKMVIFHYESIKERYKIYSESFKEVNENEKKEFFLNFPDTLMANYFLTKERITGKDIPVDFKGDLNRFKWITFYQFCNSMYERQKVMQI